MRGQIDQILKYGVSCTPLIGQPEPNLTNQQSRVIRCTKFYFDRLIVFLLNGEKPQILRFFKLSRSETEI